MFNVLSANNPGLWFLYIVLIFGALAATIFLIKKFVFDKRKPEDEKVDEKEAASQNLSRVLEEVDDPEMQKQFDEYNKKLEEENDSKSE